MPVKSKFLPAALAAFSLALSACSTQTWYEAVKGSAENECRKALPSDYERCMSQLNRKSYDDYERERVGSKK
jgi:hypothetical protein